MSDRTILLLLEDVNHLLNHLQVDLVFGVRDVVDSFGCAHDHRDERGEGMLQLMAIHVQHLQDEVKALGLLDVEDVDFNQLADKVSSLVWRDLERINTETKQNFGQAALGLRFFIFGLEKLVLVILKHLLRDQERRRF